MWRWALPLLLAVLWNCSRAQAQDFVSCEGPLTGDELRHPQANVAKRTLYDLAAVPASVVAWDALDFSLFGATALTTGALMLPPKNSLDVRFQNWLKRNESPTLEQLFFKIRTVPEAAVLVGAGAVLFGTAYLFDNEPLFEFGSLSLEALGVAQFYHIASKLLLGREGPHQGGGDGEVHGPTVFLFPGGSPSGHAATAYALLAVAAEYWRKWPVWLLGHAAALYIGASLVYERQHFVSDVIWGAAMGYAIGRWVVKHRSSGNRCRMQSAPVWQRALFFPIVTTRGGLLAASLSF